MSKPVMQAFLIDVIDKTVRPVEYATLNDMQAFVGGPIESAYMWPNGDTLYVDEEGLFKQTGWFYITVRQDQPFASNGLLVGAETGYSINTKPPGMTLEALRRMVRFPPD